MSTRSERRIPVAGIVCLSAVLAQAGILVAFLVGSLVLSGAQVTAGGDPAWDAVVPFPVFPVPPWLMIGRGVTCGMACFTRSPSLAKVCSWKSGWPGWANSASHVTGRPLARVISRSSSTSSSLTAYMPPEFRMISMAPRPTSASPRATPISSSRLALRQASGRP